MALPNRPAHIHHLPYLPLSLVLVLVLVLFLSFSRLLEHIPRPVPKPYIPVTLVRLLSRFPSPLRSLMLSHVYSKTLGRGTQ